MMKRLICVLAAPALILGLAAFVKPDPRLDKAARAAACDRACLEGFLDQYLEPWPPTIHRRSGCRRM